MIVGVGLDERTDVAIEFLAQPGAESGLKFEQFVTGKDDSHGGRQTAKKNPEAVMVDAMPDPGEVSHRVFDIVHQTAPVAVPADKERCRV